MRSALALLMPVALFAFIAPLAAQNGSPPAQSSASQGRDKASPDESDAQNDELKRSGGQRPNKAARTPGITKGREAAVMTFVQEHHPDLEALLRYLKQNRPADYEKAFRELFAVSERLARTQEQDEVRYELDLARWKLQSRIQLLAARFKMEQSEELREQLREALAEQVDVEIAIAERDRERLAERLQRMQAKIDRLSEGKQEQVENQLRLLTQERRISTPVSTRDATEKSAEKSESKPKSDAKPPRPATPK